MADKGVQYILPVDCYIVGSYFMQQYGGKREKCCADQLCLLQDTT